METAPILKINQLQKCFGGLTAVNNVDMEIREGELIGLIGANGAGKTTLFNMIAGSFKPSSGSICFMGKDITGFPAHKVCHLGIGRTYQIVRPFASLSVLENTMVGAMIQDSNLGRARKKAEEILEFLGLYHRKDACGNELNLPELKRMEVARALATDPKLLLLDEVMAGLTPADSEVVIDLVHKINDSGITVIIIEHVMKAVMSLSQRIYVLNQGGLIAQGTPKEVSENAEVIKSYLGEKARKEKGA